MRNLAHQRIRISAALLFIGLATATAGYQLADTFPYDVRVAITLWFLGVTLMGAGSLCPFHRTMGGACAGFIVAAYLSASQVHDIGTNANETFANIAAELDAIEAESSNDSDAAKNLMPADSHSE